MERHNLSPTEFLELDEQRDIICLYKFLDAMEVRYDDDFKDSIDYWFDELKEKKCKELQVTICNYDCYKSANHNRRRTALRNCKREVAEYIRMHTGC